MQVAPIYSIVNRKIYYIYSVALTFFTLIHSNTLAQYTINGDATRDNCHCYTLTPDDTLKAGSVWNNNKIDLNRSFSFTFNIYPGCTDVRGADGLAFVLQTSLASLGDTGRGLGFQSISPSVAVTLDAYQNLANRDPAYDHLSIQTNGNIDHNTITNLAGPVKASPTSDNIEDCNWHLLKVNWNAATKTIDVYFDGSLRLTLNKDFVTDVFNGQSSVYWGFTGATGGFGNLQKFCAILSSDFKLLSTQKRCIGEGIRFYDSSFSTGPIKRYWNFGDGSPVDSVSVNPVHIYASANDYPVTLTVQGIDGCTETKSETIRIGTKPIANYTVENACQESLVLKDSSYTNFGTVNSWYWNFGNGIISTQKDPIASYTTTGSKRVSLAVKTSEGCLSDTISKNIIVDKRAVPEAIFSNACKNSIVDFKAIDNAGTNVSQWYWGFGDGITDSGVTTQHIYKAANNYPVQLYTITANGCISDTTLKVINIYGTDASAGDSIIIAAALQPVQLHATGGVSYQWSPSAGLSNSNIADPVATLTIDQTYYLKAFTPEGCESFDTVTIKIYKGPEIYVPNAFSPNNDGVNDVFKTTPVGIIQFTFLKVFNRWGKEIFTSPDFKRGWDGTFNGKPQTADIYVWRVSGIDFRGTQIIKKGVVMLIR